jgi:hypothetical protein
VPGPFNHTILGLAVGRGGTNADTVGFEETSDITLNQALIKVATHTFRKTAGVNKESPESINNALTGSGGKAIDPAMTCG